jgi:hypothetical protein
VNQPVKFKVDEANFGQQAEFRWVWSEGRAGNDTGTQATHTFTKPGTYKVTLEARFSSAAAYAEAGSVAVNVAPKAGYSLPTAKVEVNPRALVDGFEVGFDAKTTHDAEAKIVHYDWDFGDGDKAEGKTVQHTYRSREFVASPYLKVTDSNGLVSEVAFDLRNRGAEVVTADIEGLAGVAAIRRTSNRATWLLLVITAVALAAVGAGGWRQRRRKAAGTRAGKHGGNSGGKPGGRRVSKTPRAKKRFKE